MKLDKIVTKVLTSNAWKATHFLSEKEVVRVTRRLFGKQVAPGDIELCVKIGKPNYLERKFIELAKKAGEPFPIRKLWLKFPPRRKRG